MQVIVPTPVVERVDADFRAFATEDDAVAALIAPGRFSDPRSREIIGQKSFAGEFTDGPAFTRRPPRIPRRVRVSATHPGPPVEGRIGRPPPRHGRPTPTARSRLRRRTPPST
jgi:hypothetical protein